VPSHSIIDPILNVVCDIEHTNTNTTASPFSARQTISDNLELGITKACFHEPMVNRTYADMAALGHCFLFGASLLAT
jgi:hypothetical protein